MLLHCKWKKEKITTSGPLLHVELHTYKQTKLEVTLLTKSAQHTNYSVFVKEEDVIIYTGNSGSFDHK